MTNPLLQPGLRKHDIPFSAIHAPDFTKAFDVLVPQWQAEHEASVTTAPLTYQALFVDGEAGPQLHAVMGLLAHLTSVADTPALRIVYETWMPALSQMGEEMRLDVRGWQKVRDYLATDDYAALPALRKKLVAEVLKGYEQGGIHLPDDKKTRLAEISARMEELSHQFETHLTDFTTESVLAFPREALAGVPERTLRNAIERPDGTLELSMVSGGFADIMEYCDVEATRKAVYEYELAQGIEERRDNRPVLAEILVLRRETAALLGHGNFAALTVKDNMAQTPETARTFTENLARLAMPQARDEMTNLDSFGAKLLGRPVQFWDRAYVAEKYQKSYYAVDTEALRAYFPVSQVVHGLFALVERLYNIAFVPDDTLPIWHQDVTAWRVVELDSGVERGTLYLDLFKRKHKDEGAWMNPAVTRHVADGDARLPVVYLVCNAPKDQGRTPTFTFGEVVTLFHEMGHALHNLLTDVDEEFFSGLSHVQHDAVELPSQFMENFCRDYEVVRSLSAHIETGLPLPEEEFSRLENSRLFLAASTMLGTARWALLDMALHMGDAVDAQAVEEQILETWSVRERDKRVQVLPTFSHIFAGGYAAGYYAYQWAEMLSADAFAALKEAGNTRAEQHARTLAFRQHVLASGGVDGMLENFQRFRGRAPDLRFLLQDYGIAVAGHGQA